MKKQPLVRTKHGEIHEDDIEQLTAPQLVGGFLVLLGIVVALAVFLAGGIGPIIDWCVP